MAVPKIRYVNTVKSSIGENNSLEYYKVYIRDTVIPADLNLPFKSAGGFSLDYPGNDNSPEDVFFGSNCTIPFLVESAQQQSFIDSVISDQESKYLIDITKTDGVSPESPYWRGIIVTDEIEHENREFPYVVNLVAIDGISQLKQRDVPNVGGFINVNGANLPKTLLESLKEFISQSSVIDLFEDTDELIVTNCRWFTNSMAQVNSNRNDPIANLRYQGFEIEYVYDKYNNVILSKSFDVIKDLLKSLYCRLIQINGSFHIIQINSYKDSNIRVHSYSKNYARTTQDPNDSPIGQLLYNVDIPVLKVLDNNLPISSGVYTQETGALYRYFGAAKRTVAEYVVDQTDQISIVDFRKATFQDSKTSVVADANLTLILTFDLFLNYESARLKTIAGSSFDFSYTAKTIIQLYVTDGTTDYYYDGTLDNWVAGGTTLEASNFNTVGTMGYTTVSVGQIAQGETNTAYTSVLNAQSPPISGDIFVKIQAGAIQGQANWNFLQNLKEWSNTLTVQYDGDIKELVEYSAENTLAPDSSIEIDLGTMRMGDQKGDVFWQCWLCWDGTDFNDYTKDWSLETVAPMDKDLTELYLTEVLSIRRAPVARFDVTILGDYNPLLSVLYDGQNYAFFGGTFDSKMGAWSVTMIQVTYNDTNIGVVSSDNSNPATLTARVSQNNNNSIQARVRWVGEYTELPIDERTLLYNDMVKNDGWLAVVVNQDGTTAEPDGINTDYDYLPTPRNSDLSNPFEYITNNEIAIRASVLDLDPQLSVFKYDANFDIIHNPLVTEDTFFIVVGDEIRLK